MAAKKNEPKAATRIPEPPKDWTDLAPTIVGYYDPEQAEDADGNPLPLMGKLVGVQRRKTDLGVQVVYLAELAAACKDYPLVGSGGEVINGQPGEIIGITERASLRPLRPYVSTGGEFWLCATEKDTLKGGRAFWRFKLRVRGEPGTVAKPPIQATDSDDWKADESDPEPF